LCALGNLALQLLPTNLTTLRQRNVKRLGTDNLVVHFRHRLRRLVGGGETNESKAFGSTLVVTHNLAARDGPEWLELCAEFVVIDVIFQILDVEIDTLILAQFFHLCCFVRPAQLILAFRFLLSTRDEELPAILIKIVKSVDGHLCFLVAIIIDESEALALPLVIE
jgi:hypothetical protein